MDKNQKGTDHRLSLQPNEFKQLISHVRDVEQLSITSDIDDKHIFNILSHFATGTDLNDVKQSLKPIQRKIIFDCEMECRMKLGKSLVYSKNLESGLVLTTEMICAKVSEPFGISADRFIEFIGRTLQTDVGFDDNLQESHFNRI